MARDSIEALRRLQYGLKSVEEIEELPLKRLSISAAEEGEWKGLRLHLRNEGGELVCEPIPQVGFAKRGGHGWTFLSEQELADISEAIPNDADPKAGIWIIAPSDSSAESLVALLAGKGIGFEKKVDLPPPASGGGRVIVEISYRIDPIIRRCVAKIAFNYMAYIGGSEFACHPDFNIIRSFIRHGVSQVYPLVIPTQERILADELPRWRGTKDHLITLNWKPFSKNIVGQVSLFNEITYRVEFARNFSGLWRDIQKGHRFDRSGRRVKRLTYGKLARPKAMRRRT